MNRTLAALALAASALLGACSSKECTLPEIKCGDRCVDGSSDPSNCGACGVTVKAGETCCGTPVDLRTSASSCGACGHRCPVNGVCNAGTCECPGTLPDQCNVNPGACVNLATGDGGYCGQCGWVCAATGVSAVDAPCSGGTCHCAGTPQAIDCGNGGSGQCVNSLTDERNCGGCGATNAAFLCKPHAICTNGTCGCTDPAFPNGCTAACTNWKTDASNCGSCGNACTGATPVCSDGICCPTGQVNCGSGCVNRQTSPANCGACGNVCAAGESCVGGTCTCAGSTPLDCGGTCCAGTACCAGGTACQPPRSNGLGGTFYFGCEASPQLNAVIAGAAADSWFKGGSTFQLFCSGNCLARQTTTSCAMWCFDGTFAGHATSGGLACAALCTNFLSGPTPTWP